MNIVKKTSTKARDYIHTIFCPNVKVRNANLIFDRDVKLKLDKSAIVNLNGYLRFNTLSMGLNGRTSILRMDKNSVLNVNENFGFAYGADIVIFEGGTLNLGKSNINSDCKIRCHQEITIGDNCAISHDFTVMDSDAHSLNGNRNTNPVIIGDNVWIGTRVTILSGVKVGNGAVIAAGALVNHDVPEHVLVAGVPAKVIKQNIEWSL